MRHMRWRNSVLLRRLPFADPDRLMTVFSWNTRSGAQMRASALDFADWRRDARAFEAMAGYTGTGFTFSGRRFWCCQRPGETG